MSSFLKAYADPAVAEEDRANACPGEAVRKSESTKPGTPLEGGYANRTASDRFARVKEPSAGPANAAEGDTRAGGSTAARMAYAGFIVIC